MHNITYAANSRYPVAILLKSFLVQSQQKQIKQYYVDLLVQEGVKLEDIIVIGLPYTDFKTCSAATMNAAIPELQEFMDSCGCLHVLVADTPYLKKLTKLQKITNLAGVLLPSVFGSQRLFKGRVYTTYPFDDKAAERVNMSIKSLAESYKGVYSEKEFLTHSEYPTTTDEIKKALTKLLDYPVLAVDIETFGLRLDSGGVGTIAFAWSQSEGIAFPVDYIEQNAPIKPNQPVRDLLLNFFIEYQKRNGVTLYHGVSFDVKHLVANIFMKNDLLDYKSMVDGIECMTENALCTKDISYLATHSTVGNDLALKHLALEYTGRYAIDVTDITKHPVSSVLEYNLKDAAATYYVFNKNYPKLAERKQNKLYTEKYQKNQRTLITAELTGMPLDMDEVIKLRTDMDTMQKSLLAQIRELDTVKDYVQYKAHLKYDAYIAGLKNPGRPFDEYYEWKKEELEFTPTQDRGIVWILHDHYQLPVIDKTLKTRTPSVGADTLEKHIDWLTTTPTSNSPEIIHFLKLCLDYLTLDKINGTFVKAFITKSIKKKDGVYYLHGNLSQGTTLSGRLSSNDPNLQNLPASGYWGTAIKRCFKAPKGYTNVSSDYNALEARIAPMLTKDPNMAKVFTDGFDSHSQNTYAYAEGTESWYSQIKDPNDPSEINKIMTIAEEDRKNSKPVTFALQFLGTYKTLMNKKGFSETKAKRLEDAYHNLYSVYFKENEKVTDQAAIDGFITVAYGLRIDTPAIHKSITGTKVTPASVEAEVRSISNARCQSYGQMNTFAADKFMRRVWDSKWRYLVHLQNLIHDAIYLFIPQSIECLEWVNKNLIECMCDQMEPAIEGSGVTLEAEMDIHYPTWAEKITIKNNATAKEIAETIKLNLT